jgi:hypothetical protein
MGAAAEGASFAADAEAAAATAARAMVIFCGEIHINVSVAHGKRTVDQKIKAAEGKNQIIRLHFACCEAQIFADAAAALHGDAHCGINILLAQMLLDGI